MPGVAAFFYGGRPQLKDDTLIYGIGQGAEGAKTQAGQARAAAAEHGAGGRVHLNIGTRLKASDSRAR